MKPCRIRMCMFSHVTDSTKGKGPGGCDKLESVPDFLIIKGRLVSFAGPAQMMPCVRACTCVCFHGWSTLPSHVWQDKPHFSCFFSLNFSWKLKCLVYSKKYSAPGVFCIYLAPCCDVAVNAHESNQLKEPHADTMLDKYPFDSARVSCLWFLKQQLYRSSWVYLPSARLSSLQTWHNLIGVKENFMFSSQCLLSCLFFFSFFFSRSSQKMTHFICWGLGNKIILLLYGPNSLICSVPAAKEDTLISYIGQTELMVMSFR